MKQLLAHLDRVMDAADEVRSAATKADDQDAMADVEKISFAATKLRSYLEGLDAEAVTPDDLPGLRHRLRTPINQVLGYCELMLEEAEDVADTPWENALRAIHAEARALPGMIDELIEQAHAPPTPRYRSRTNPETAAERRARTSAVLVVDDNATNRDMLSRRLERDGHFVFEATNGEQALETARSVAVDLVLLDIMMPIMDGYTTLAAFKADERLRHVPIIMLTSLDEPESISRCIELGAEDHLPKPFDPVLLRARIGACLEKKALHDREVSYREKIVREKQRVDALLNVVIPLGVALSAESEYDRLLERIVTETRELCNADGGALFLRQGDTLHPVFLECASLGLRRSAAEGQGEGDGAIALDGSSDDPVVAATLTGEPRHVPDISALSGPASARLRRFDAELAYETRSVLVVPLHAVGADVVGALQLWNARDLEQGTIAGFDEGLVQLVSSMSSLAGAALANYSRVAKLERHIEKLEILVDEKRREEQVAEITETEYFRQLRDKARSLRRSSS